MQCVKKNVVSLIRSEENELATAWTAPDILSEPEVVEPTEEELARERAYQEGVELGRADGIEQGRQEGQEAGFQEGLQKGQAQIDQQQAQLQQQQAEYAEQLQQLEALVSALKNPLESQLDETVNEAIATLVTRISRQVVKNELSVHPEHIVGVVNQLFQEMPMTEREVQFYLHPEDKALLESSMELSTRSFDWKMEGDEEMTRGGCHVESRNFSVDERVEQRMEQAVQKVFGFTPENGIETAEETAEQVASEENLQEVDEEVDEEQADVVSEGMEEVAAEAPDAVAEAVDETTTEIDPATESAEESN